MAMVALTHSTPMTLGYVSGEIQFDLPSYRQFHPSKSEGHSLYTTVSAYMEGREKFPSSKMLPDYFISKLLRCILKSDSDT